MEAASALRCQHCGAHVTEGASDPRFCCRGCQSVHELLIGEGLGRYYELDRPGAPAPAPVSARDQRWLDPILASAEQQAGPVCSVTLDVGGIHCAACVWLIEELFHRRTASGTARVNPALGKVELLFTRGAVDVRGFVGEVERFGYRFGPDRKRATARGSSMTLRLGICAALTINAMLFSFSFYSGLAPKDGALFTLFSNLVLVFSTLVVLVGGSVFFRAAWQGLRARILHLDLPIAVGIALAYGASLVQARGGRGDHAYLDTLCVFVTLMLVGRWLQDRLIDRNRRVLLEDEAIDRLSVRRRAGDRIEHVPAGQIVAGDVLLITPADLVPVDLALLDPGAQITTAWITGEPNIRTLARAELVPAGACNAGQAAFSGIAQSAFADSVLPRLLRAGGSSAGTDQAYRRLWSRFSQVYVLAVLGLAALALALWWRIDPSRAIDVTVALLVVTCPCAVGIAGPLAYELALGHLRRRGLFIRSGNLLDKLTRVRKILFDKTGTLTLGTLELGDDAPLRALQPALRDQAYTMASRSSHPVSRCLAASLARLGARADHDALVIEEPGKGLELRAGGKRLRLGAPAWAGHRLAPPGSVALSVDGELVCLLGTREELRGDARAAIAELHGLGCEVWILSGDAPGRVQGVAEALAIPGARVHAGMSPADKARKVQAIDREDTLFFGDGVNDALAFERALVAGTPAIDRPVLPSKADFFVLGDGIQAVVEAIRSARRLRSVVRRNLTVAITYNLLVVGACLAGRMTPLRAAVLMPLSSLSILFATIYSLSERRWRS